MAIPQQLITHWELGHECMDQVKDETRLFVKTLGPEGVFLAEDAAMAPQCWPIMGLNPRIWVSKFLRCAPRSARGARLTYGILPIETNVSMLCVCYAHAYAYAYYAYAYAILHMRTTMSSVCVCVAMRSLTYVCEVCVQCVRLR